MQGAKSCEAHPHDLTHAGTGTRAYTHPSARTIAVQQDSVDLRMDTLSRKLANVGWQMGQKGKVVHD